MVGLHQESRGGGLPMSRSTKGLSNIFMPFHHIIISYTFILILWHSVILGQVTHWTVCSCLFEPPLPLQSERLDARRPQTRLYVFWTSEQTTKKERNQTTGKQIPCLSSAGSVDLVFLSPPVSQLPVGLNFKRNFSALLETEPENSTCVCVCVCTCWPI